MANLRTRGQLLLIGAVVLAVAFIGLSIVINTAIFTENLATEQDTDAERALVYQQEITRTMEDTVQAANWQNNSDTSSLDDAVEETVDETANHTGRQAAEESIIASISVQSGSTEHGSLIFQNESDRAFETGNANVTLGAGDWVVVGDVHSPDGAGTRAFTMNVTEVPDSPALSPFTVHVDEDGNGYGSLANSEWNMTVEGNVTDTSDPVTVEVNSGVLGGGPTCSKDVEKGYVRIDVTAGTVAGEPCDALRGDSSFANGVTNPYNVAFENGDTVRGNYSLVTTNETVADLAEDNSSSPGYHLNWTDSQGAPYGRFAIYDLSIDLEFYSTDVSYEAKFRIARGEPDE